MSIVEEQTIQAIDLGKPWQYVKWEGKWHHISRVSYENVRVFANFKGELCREVHYNQDQWTPNPLRPLDPDTAISEDDLLALDTSLYEIERKGKVSVTCWSPSRIRGGSRWYVLDVPVDSIVEVSYDTGYCKHGVWVGGMGVDWMCQACEDGE